METIIEPLSEKFVLIRVKGRVDSYSAPILREELDTLARSGQNSMLIDLSESDFISSDGIMVFADIKEYLMKRKGEIVLFKPSRQVKKALKFAGFEDYFRTYSRKEDLISMGITGEDNIMSVMRSGKAGILKIIQSPDTAMKDIELFEGKDISLGRSRENVVCLAHPTVSRKHSMVSIRSGAVTIIDKGSTNGTYVNGKKIEGECKLNEKDKIEIGEYYFTLLS